QAGAGRAGRAAARSGGCGRRGRMTGGARREFVNRLLSQPALCLAEVYRKRGDVYDHTGVYEKAKTDYYIARTLYQNVDCYTESSEIDYSLGNLLLNMGSFEQAEKAYNQALEYFRASHDNANIIKCYKELGKAYQYRENLVEALYYFNRAHQIAESIQDDRSCDVLTEYIADVKRAEGNYSEALKTVLELISQYNSLSDERSLCRLLKLAGYIYLEMGQNEQAEIFLERAYKYSSVIGEKIMAMYILGDLGLVSYNLKRYDLACERFEKCLEMAVKLDSEYMKTVNMVNLADALLQQGDFKRSKEFVNRAATINHNIGGLSSEIKRIQEEIAKKEGGQEKAGQEKNIETQGKKGPYAP
ncbi:MAG: tetratricopeptide repeat protein, partial [Rhodocyclaceae bacterium]|nr:tetratricopeptide repeat protein [Rhodocyclaceae bacterium]